MRDIGLTYQVKDLKEVVSQRNIAEKMGIEDLRKIGQMCKAEFDADKSSRSSWETWYADAMKLALQVMEEKTFPWPNASNVKFPLITVAAINFHAKAYPGLINSQQVVTYRPLGLDPDGKKEAQAKRVTDHQNFLLLEASSWEEQTDRALLNLPIMGCVFKKTFYDHDKRMVVSDLRLAMDIVVPYFTKSLETTARINETFSLNANQFVTKVRRGQYLDYETEHGVPYSPGWESVTTDALQEARNQAQKLEMQNYNTGAPGEFVEQHRGLDLDGDGYDEPYIVTFVRSTGQVCRIVARFTSKDVEYVTDKDKKRKVAYIEPTHFYTKYSFIPSPDGGFYDLGFGMLLGPVNFAVDSLINQIIDAGTLDNLGGGFLARGVKMRKGETNFEPGEWKTVDSVGASLKDNIVPLPVRPPSQVLMDLLLFLVQYSERISSANEVQMGELPGENTKARALEIANQNGMRVFAAIYKRLWRCFKEEFCRIYCTTAVYAEGGIELGGRDGAGKWFQIQPGDYRLPPDGIWPAANPSIASQDQEINIAEKVMATVTSIGGQDQYEATMRYYRALRVPNPEKIFPDPKSKDAIPQQPSDKLIAANAKAQDAQTKLLKVQFERNNAFAETLMKARKVAAEIENLMAQAELYRAQAKSEPIGHAIALIDAELGAKRDAYKGYVDVLKILREGMNDGSSQGTQAASQSGRNGVSGMEAPTGNSKVLPVSNGSAGGNETELGTEALQ